MMDRNLFTGQPCISLYKNCIYVNSHIPSRRDQGNVETSGFHFPKNAVNASFSGGLARQRNHMACAGPGMQATD